ncbi:hypothetical protein V6N12_065269 [Hibiscus sabdariffa]|uniref:Uncharacterized protein n=1 Tax=Hibiscus sabdariffa TaxID=183260 RepID=A0ABR2G879_9ROSI
MSFSSFNILFGLKDPNIVVEFFLVNMVLSRLSWSEFSRLLNSNFSKNKNGHQSWTESHPTSNRTLGPRIGHVAAAGDSLHYWKTECTPYVFEQWSQMLTGHDRDSSWALQGQG